MCRRSERGQPTSVACSDVRLMPVNALARDLAESDANEQEAEHDHNENVEALMTTMTGDPTKDVGI